MTLLCSKCKVEKPEEDFKIIKSYANSGRTKPSTRNCRDSWCRSCHCKAQKGYVAKKDPEDHKQMKRAVHYRGTYGITLGEYDKLNAFRGGCWICGRQGKTRGLSVDHNHKSGQVRGLLCQSCNRGLRWFSDEPARLREAATYLETSDQLMAAALSTDVTGAHQPVGESNV